MSGVILIRLRGQLRRRESDEREALYPVARDLRLSCEHLQAARDGRANIRHGRSTGRCPDGFAFSSAASPAVFDIRNHIHSTDGLLRRGTSDG